jgi:hypothetical protein
VFSRTRSAHLEHEQAKAELKGLMPEDAKEAAFSACLRRASKSCIAELKCGAPPQWAAMRSITTLSSTA